MSSRRPKLEGLIEMPKETIHTTRYKINAEGKSMILTIFETTNSITFYLGGYKIYCIDAQIIKLKPGTFLDEGNLSKVRYDMKCSTLRPENEKEAAFEKGKDTSMILRLMMTYIKDNYPDVKALTFTDLSTRKCDNGVSVSLSAMKLFIDGKTWYEDHFGAKISPKFEPVYTSIMNDANEKKRKLSWDDFYDSFIASTTLPLEKEKMKQLYNKADSWQEFFKNIRDSIGISALCVWFSQYSWFELAFLKYLKFSLFNFSFLLTTSDFSQEYSIEPFTGGWRGVTRKASRLKVTHKRRHHK